MATFFSYLMTSMITVSYFPKNYRWKKKDGLLNVYLLKKTPFYFTPMTHCFIWYDNIIRKHQVIFGYQTHFFPNLYVWLSITMYTHGQRFVTDCKDLITMIQEPQAWPNFSTELEIIQTLRLCYSDFKISYLPRAQNEIADSLARNARSFHRSLCFIGCSIPIWLSRPPQVWVIE